jgi:predicted deacylase
LSRLLRLGLAVAFLALAAGSAWAAEVERPGRRHQVYFANTPDELNVYRVYGAEDGKTMMIIGGIQGNEPGGFLSADLYADITLAKGNVIVVPRANFYSIILNQRSPDGDMNRQFGDPVTARRHKKIVDVLKRLMSESDILLNLHDGSGFYRPRWEGPMANPRRYGQSLIADAGTYLRPDGAVIDLEGIAQRVLAKVNPRIANPDYHLLFNNHRTASKNSAHKEQRLSATYYALTRCHIPAFGVETSKSLPSQAMKVRHHNLVINAFMQELGIVPESPSFHLEEPELEFLVASINGANPVVVNKGGSLYVHPGDEVLVLHLEANYERGLNCDFLGLGSVNDLRQPFRIRKPTTVVARKDHQEIGRIHIKVTGGEQTFTTVRSPILYFLVELGGQRRVVADGEVLKAVKGDKLTLVDCLSNLPTQRDLQVNFKGFVPAGRRTNTGEDRGFLINTAKDLMARYAGCEGPTAPGVECYEVVASQADARLGSMRVEVAPARLDYLVLRHDQGPKMVYHNGEVVRAEPGERLEVVDVKTNVWSPSDLELAVENRGRRQTLEDRSIRIGPEAAAGSRRLVVLRQTMAIGHVRLKIGGSQVER